MMMIGEDWPPPCFTHRADTDIPLRAFCLVALTQEIHP